MLGQTASSYYSSSTKIVQRAPEAALSSQAIAEHHKICYIEEK